MPIQILDNFEVNIAKPIDNRFVVGSQSFYTNKEQIPYRYPGLRIWDLNDNFPYIWTGVTWSNENQSGSVIGSGIVNRLAKFTGINNIGSSIVFDNGINVGINIFAPTDRLHVDGNIRSTGNFIGNGSLLTSLNATNITSGSLSLTRITAGTSGQILVRGSSNAEFVNATSITVGTASTLTINPASNDAIYHVPFFSTPAGLPSNRQIFATSSSIQINPSTGNVGIGTSPLANRRLTVSGTVRITGGTPSAGKFLMSENNNGDARWENSIPVGSIIMWGGAANDIPSGWLLCNGATLTTVSPLRTQLIDQTNPFGAQSGNPRIPDLRERFVVGAGGDNPSVTGSSYNVGATGGANSVTLDTTQIPKHKHKLDNGVDGAIFNESGTHNHLGGFSGNMLFEGGDLTGTFYGVDDDNSRGIKRTSLYNNAGSHRHTGNTGDGTTDGLSGQSHENRPPFFALCYIIKTGLL
jgi:microcystin-dependent protein